MIPSSVSQADFISPALYPDGNVLFNFAEAEKMTYFGTLAKFTDALRRGPVAQRTHKIFRRCASSPGAHHGAV